MTDQPTQQPAIVLDTPEQIQMFALLQAAYRLALEINSPLKFRQSTLAALQHAGITSKRTKKGALEDLVLKIKKEHNDPNWEPKDSLARALGEPAVKRIMKAKKNA
jgi:hypothetical protein